VTACLRLRGGKRIGLERVYYIHGTDVLFSHMKRAVFLSILFMDLLLFVGSVKVFGHCTPDILNNHSKEVATKVNFYNYENSTVFNAILCAADESDWFGLELEMEGRVSVTLRAATNNSGDTDVILYK
jgi:hypothetical protein